MNKSLLGAMAALATIIAVPSLAAPAPAKKAAAKPAVARDWSKTVTVTAAGGYRMGNPAAKVTLVEYGSMTCPHCGHFATDDEPKLIDKYVRGGKVAFEFRNFIRDPFDIAAALTARCSGTTGFFPVTHQLFATQEQWFAKLRAVGDERLKALQNLTPAQQMSQVADLAGFSDVAKARGIPLAKYKACIGDKKNMDALMKLRNDASFVEGTPTFVLNGAKVEFDAQGPALWDQLDAKIAAAL